MSTRTRVQGVGGLGIAGIVVGILGLALVAYGLRTDPKQAGYSYLAAYGFGATVVLGALAFVMVGHVTGARWFVVIRRPVEAVAATLPIYILLFVPLALAFREVYPWAGSGPLDARVAEVVERKRSYLDPTFFFVRAGIYLLVWSVLSTVLWRSSVRGDSRAPGTVTEPRALCAAALPAFALTFTFAMFDWLMSIEPAWYSSMYAIYCFSGAFRSALALAIVLTWAWRARGLFPDGVGSNHFHALGRLLLTFIIFWAYIAFSQGMIIWITDVPAESGWYVTRTLGGWGAIFTFVGVAGFVLPFLVLLPRRVKRAAGPLALVSVVLLLVHYTDIYWLVMPALHEDGPRPHWLDAASIAAVLGTTVASAAFLLRGTATTPWNAPGLEVSLRYRS